MRAIITWMGKEHHLVVIGGKDLVEAGSGCNKALGLLVGGSRWNKTGGLLKGGIRSLVYWREE